MTGDGAWWGNRVWTPAEAAASLPLVRRITDDLLDCYRRWLAAVEAFEYATSGTQVDAPNPGADRLMTEAQALAEEIDGLQLELLRLDIRVTRLEHGLIAFRSEKGGEIVPLFWAPASVAPSYDWPDSVPAYGMSTSWPSRAPLVAGKRSRA